MRLMNSGLKSSDLLQDLGLGPFCGGAVRAAGEAEGRALVQVARAEVRGDDEDRRSEAHGAPDVVGELAAVEDLEEC